MDASAVENSAVLRAEQAWRRGDAKAEVLMRMARAYTWGAVPHADVAARHVLGALYGGASLRAGADRLRSLLDFAPAQNLVA